MLDRRQGLKAGLALAGLAAAGPAARAAAPAVVALSEERSRFLVDVEINGRAGFRFVLDTGSTAHFVATGVAQRLGLPEVEQRMVRGFDGRSRNSVVAISRLTVGGVELGRSRAIAWGPERLEQHDGLIGYPFLFPHAILDLGAGRISLGARPSPPLTPVKAQVMRNQALLLGGVDGAEGRFIFDTGSQACTLSPAYFRRVAETEAYRNAPKLVRMAPDGRSETTAFRPAELRFGELRIPEPTVRIGRNDGRQGVFENADALFGVSLIRRYTWALDQAAGRLSAGAQVA